MPRQLAADILKKMVNAGRLAPSAANVQPLEFIVVNDSLVMGKIFATLKWAGYLSPAGDPADGERPTAYIVVLINSKIRQEQGEIDAAAAIENMILTALDEKIGSCWIRSINRIEIQKILNIPEHYQIDSVLALGYPAEQPETETFQGSIKYWKDEQGVLHVPKRELVDVIHFNKFSNKKSGY